MKATKSLPTQCAIKLGELRYFVQTPRLSPPAFGYIRRGPLATAVGRVEVLGPAACSGSPALPARTDTPGVPQCCFRPVFAARAITLSCSVGKGITLTSSWCKPVHMASPHCLVCHLRKCSHSLSGCKLRFMVYNYATAAVTINSFLLVAVLLALGGKAKFLFLYVLVHSSQKVFCVCLFLQVPSILPVGCVTYIYENI